MTMLIFNKKSCWKLNIVLCLVYCLLVSTFHISPVFAEDQHIDVYLIYTVKDKKVMKQLRAALKKNDLRVKKYSLDLLALADYSVKQKKTAKFNTAKVIVIVTTGNPNQFISMDRLNNSVLVSHFSSETLKTIEQSIHNSSRKPL